MPGYQDFIKKESVPRIESLRDDMARRKNKDFFWPNGLQVYVGRQGSGKTISMVKRLMDLHKRYPKAIVVSNLRLKFLRGVTFNDEADLLRITAAFASGSLDANTHYIRFTDGDSLQLVLVSINNGFNGVVYALDELHLYFNSLNSKGVPVTIMTEVSQQRKQRKLILGTSQIFQRMAKPFREQADSIIVCRTMFGVITSQQFFLADTLTTNSSGNLEGKRTALGWFFHRRLYRNAFDTYQKVISAQMQSGIDLDSMLETSTVTITPTKKNFSRKVTVK